MEGESAGGVTQLSDIFLEAEGLWQQINKAQGSQLLVCEFIVSRSI